MQRRIFHAQNVLDYFLIISDNTYWNIHSIYWIIELSFIVYGHIMDVLNKKQWLEKYKLCSNFFSIFFEIFRNFSKFYEKLNIVFRMFRKIIFRKMDNL
jgi:hypothetical protein